MTSPGRMKEEGKSAATSGRGKLGSEASWEGHPGTAVCVSWGTAQGALWVSITFGVVGQTLDSKPLLKGPAEQIDLLLEVPHFDHPADTPDSNEGLVRVAGDRIDGIPGFHKELLEFGAIHGHVVHGGVKRPNDKIPDCQGDTQEDQPLQGMATPRLCL